LLTNQQRAKSREEHPYMYICGPPYMYYSFICMASSSLVWEHEYIIFVEDEGKGASKG
jgi:hypothetical protein